jgi:acid-sensing ion channel, other
MLHTPGEMPQVSKQYYQVPLNQQVLVAIKPQMMTTSEGLRHYSPNRSFENIFLKSSKNL